METVDNFHATELIRVAQLPVIEEQLHFVKAKVKAATDEAMSLVCTAETVQSVKTTRAELSKAFTELETMRKQVKNTVMEPYQRFEAVYKECVSDAFKTADADLKQKIDAVENEIKQTCEDKLRAFFDECCEAQHIEFLNFEAVGLKVDMASAKAKTPKKLMDQIRAFVQKVSDDMNMIARFDDCDEIMIEYKKTLDATYSIATVQERKKAKEQEHESAVAREAAIAHEADAARRVEAFAPPEVVAEPKMITVGFRVTDTRERLLALRSWLNTNGYHYE